MPTAEISRQTNETQITVKLVLDGTGQHAIDTGIGFLDHMLTHLAVHGRFDLTVQAKGDLHIDTHHTVEDVALALGQAFDQALGDRKGIVRMAASLRGGASGVAYALSWKYSNHIVPAFL